MMRERVLWFNRILSAGRMCWFGLQQSVDRWLGYVQVAGDCGLCLAGGV